MNQQEERERSFEEGGSVASPLHLDTRSGRGAGRCPSQLEVRWMCDPSHQLQMWPPQTNPPTPHRASRGRNVHRPACTVPRQASRSSPRPLFMAPPSAEQPGTEWSRGWRAGSWLWRPLRPSLRGRRRPSESSSLCANPQSLPVRPPHPPPPPTLQSLGLTEASTTATRQIFTLKRGQT